MIIIGLTDIHGDTRQLKKISADVSKADLVIVSGDLTHFGRKTEAAAVVNEIKKHNQNILAVPGNCDHPDVSTYLTAEGINLHCRYVVKNKIAFLGLGGSLPCPGHTPNEATDEELGAWLKEAIAGLALDIPLIMVIHQPPQGTLVDKVPSGAHTGSVSVRDFIIKRQPLICFSGHIHEARGTDILGKTQLVNPGPLREGHYAYAEIENSDPPLVTTLKIKTIS